MNKAYKRIKWENKPSTASPINEANLNKMDHALDTVDTRVVEIYNQKDAMSSATTAANKAADSANTAATSANTAAFNANEAAQAVLDEKYILTARTEMVRSGTARPTAKGNAILEKLTGDSWQNQLSGKNKFDKSTAISNERVDSTDGTFGGGFSAIGHSDYIEIYGMESIYISGDVSQSQTDHVCAFYSEDKAFISGITNASTSVVLQNRAISVPSNAHYIVFNFALSALDNIQLELGTEATDYEPYCGGVPSPNPSFKQDIRSVGDMGWFDGEWLQGYYSGRNLTWVSSVNYISTKNLVPCKAGDVVNVDLENVCDSIDIFWADDNCTSVSVSTGSNEKTYSFTVPSGATCFYVAIGKSNITPSTVGHVCVTINGKYAAIVDEVGKNLFGGLEFANAMLKNNTNATIDATNKSVTFQCTSWVSRHVLFKNFKKNTQYTFIFYGSNTTVNTLNMYVKFTDGTDHNLNSSEVIGKNAYLVYVTPQGKTVESIRGCNAGGVVTVYYEKCGIFEGVVSIEDFKPYQHKRTYIPLDEPLRGTGDVKDEICYRDWLYGQYRPIEEDIFNGSSGENWLYSKDMGNGLLRFSSSKLANVADYSNVYNVRSDKFTVGADIAYSCRFSTAGELFVFVPSDALSEVSAVGFTLWLADNPFKLQYPLAEPVFTPFEDQTPFYNLQSFDEVTHVSIAGLHEKLQPTLTMRFPRHEDGALVTTSYCNSKKAEIRMDELTAAMLALSQS